MVYRTISVIGLGTLGGFVSNAISNLEGLENLIIMDDDVVESKNLLNSVYRQIDLGLSKTEALMDIISVKSPDLTIIPINEKFIEGKTILPKSDLVLDCRDFTYDRGVEIDVRLYMSSRYLMVDCRRNVQYKVKTEGKYLTQLTKQDLRYAGSIVAMLISNNTISSLIKQQLVQKYELDHTKHIENYVYDIVYENPVSEDKFVNLPDKIIPIIEANKNNPISVFVGSQFIPLLESQIPKNSLKSSSDLVIALSNLVCDKFVFNNFVISFYQADNNYLLELIPETGAA